MYVFGVLIKGTVILSGPPCISDVQGQIQDLSRERTMESTQHEHMMGRAPDEAPGSIFIQKMGQKLRI